MLSIKILKKPFKDKHCCATQLKNHVTGGPKKVLENHDFHGWGGEKPGGFHQAVPGCAKGMSTKILRKFGEGPRGGAAVTNCAE